MTKHIAIVGGGFVGVELAKALQHHANITLIEPKTHFVTTPAMVRALVQPALLDRALVPYDKLLTRGTFVAARAERVDATGVTLADGRHIAADYIVVATGSTNGPAFKPGVGGIEGLRAMNGRIHAQVAAASRIAIVGAGAVGTELAGEIVHFHPDKHVTLISSDPTLFPSMPAKLGRSLLKQLHAAGVSVVLGAKAENLPSMTEPHAGALRLSNGQEIAADLIVPAVGSRANSDLLASLPGAVKTTANRIRADAWMRPSTLSNVFAAGDAVDVGDGMTIVAITRQLPWLKNALLALAAGEAIESRRPYTPWAAGKSPLIVPLGPHKGASHLIFFTGGPILTGVLKGKDVMVGKYRRLLRQP